MIRRPATLMDVEGIVGMGRRFMAQTVYRGKLADNPAQLRALATHLIESVDGDVIVAEDDSGLVGMIAVLAYTHHMSGERIAGEVAWWVEPTRRGIGIRLLKDAERWAREKGATHLQMIAPSNDVEALYERLGYEPVERTYQRRLM